MIRHLPSILFSTLLLLAPLSMAHASKSEAPTPVAKNGKDKTGIQWKIAPAKVVVYLDGKKLGEASKLDFTAATPGKHSVKLMNGEDETEMDVQVKKGQVIQVDFTFDEE